MRLPRLRLRLRTLLIAVAVAGAVLSYVGTYHRLSRRGMREAALCGYDGFLYVPFDEAAASEDLSTHYLLATFFEPLNRIDRAIFGTPTPWISLEWRLSG